jgi:hypothetical protein
MGMSLRRALTLTSALIATAPATLLGSPAIASSDAPPSASVNACGPSFGVRVSAPYRGESLAPWVRISVSYYSSQDGGWHPAAAGDSGWFPAGPAGTGADTGYTFFYANPSEGHRLVLRGNAQIDWRGPGGSTASVGTGECEVGGGAGGQTGAQRILSIGPVVGPKTAAGDTNSTTTDEKPPNPVERPAKPTETPTTTTDTTPTATTAATTATTTTTTDAASVVQQVATSTAAATTQSTTPAPAAPVS